MLYSEILILRLKEKFGFSQKELASKLDVPTTTLSSWKSRDNLDIKQVFHAFGDEIDYNWLITGKTKSDTKESDSSPDSAPDLGPSNVKFIAEYKSPVIHERQEYDYDHGKGPTKLEMVEMQKFTVIPKAMKQEIQWLLSKKKELQKHILDIDEKIENLILEK